MYVCIHQAKSAIMQSGQKITTFLWFNNEAEEAAAFYTGLFKNAKITNTMRHMEDSPAGTPGSVLTVEFTLEDHLFTALNGGPEFTFNPSVSFFVNCKTEDEVEALWNQLSEGGRVHMPLDKYPFSDKYGWIEDKYGVSWQLILPVGEAPQKIVPSLLFAGNVCGKAEEAMNFYTSIFHDSKTGGIFRYGAGQQPDKEGSIAY